MRWRARTARSPRSRVRSPTADCRGSLAPARSGAAPRARRRNPLAPALAARARCARPLACCGGRRGRRRRRSARAARSVRLRPRRSRAARAPAARKQIRRRFRNTSRAMFTIDVITLFPEVFAPFVGLSIVGRAVEAGIVRVRYHHLLDRPAGRANAPTTAPFGGGPGMVLADRADRSRPRRDRGLRTPEGSAASSRFPARAAASSISRRRSIWRHSTAWCCVCGHYEGIDDRLGALYPVREYSLGDFVLTGGEIPALAFMDATVRLLAGAIRPASLEHESFTGRHARLPQLHPAGHLPGR